MKDYDFKTLSADEFEDLARQLLNKYCNRNLRSSYVQFQSTPKGKDLGIDLYHSTEVNDFEIVVQVKHYAGSKLSNLLASLLGTKKVSNKTSELEKIKKLKPKRYIIVTSLQVSLEQKQKIKKAFEPYILVLRDIIDKKTLNNLLEDFPDVEERFVKLYFASAEVMRNIIAGANIGHGEFLQSKIESKIKIYVDTGIFKIAEQQLKFKKVLIITGEPGSGKTTLAEILIYKFLKLKYSLGYILTDISQADKIWNSENQIFYYDDFLGQNFYEGQFLQKEERPLSNFIERVAESDNKLFVLTTRTIIYNHARDNSETFKNIQKHASNLQIEVANLKPDDKIMMIKNHLHFKGIPSDSKFSLSESEISQLAYHDNFYPRIIDFITDNVSINYIQNENVGLFDYALYTLENPSEIWRLCYEKQVTEAERIFLNTLFSTGNLLEKRKLKTAFETRINNEYQQGTPGITKWISFEDCYRSLNEAFVLTAFDYNGDSFIVFINPSVADFLLSYLPKYPIEINSIVSSVHYIEQLFIRFRSTVDRNKTNHIKISLPGSFRQIIIDNSIPFESIIDFVNPMRLYNYINLYRSFLLIMYFRDTNNLNDELFKILREVDFEEVENVHFVNIYGLLVFLKDREPLNNFIHENWDKIVHLMISKCTELSNLDTIFSLFEMYKQSATKFLQNEINMYAIKNVIDDYRRNEIYDMIDLAKTYSVDLDDVEYYRTELVKILNADYKAYRVIVNKIEIEAWDSINWFDVITMNQNKIIAENEARLIESHQVYTDNDEQKIRLVGEKLA